jgi:hypothetical protein
MKMKTTPVNAIKSLFAGLMALALFAFLPYGLNAQTNTFPSTGFAGIGTTTPAFSLTVIGTEWNSSQISLTTYAGSPTPGGTDNYTPQFRFEKARGTAAAATQVENGDRIGAFLAAGYDGTKMQRSAVFGFRVDGATSAGNVPIGFFVQTGDASNNKPERLLVKSNGEVVIKDLGVSLGDRMVAVDDTGLLFTMPLPTGGGGPIALNDLTDVNTAGAVNGSVIKYNGASWVIGGDNVNDADASPTNELQTISRSGTTVTLSNGGGSVSIADNDNSSTNELQDLGSSASGTNRTITITGGTSTVISVADNDNSATNEIQTLSLAANTLSLTGGGSVNLAGYLDNTDAQTLSINAAGDLSISGGNTVNVFDSDWLYFTGSGNSGDIYHAGDVAIGSVTDPEGHGLYAQTYSSGKGAVRGTDQSGSNIYAEGFLGVLGPASLGVPISVTNVGVLGIKPAVGGSGAAVYGWNDDDNPNNYGGLFIADGTDGGNLDINYGIYAKADSAATNYAGYFEGDVYTTNRVIGSKGNMSLNFPASEGDVTFIGNTTPGYTKVLIAPSTTVNDSAALWLGEDDDGSFSMGLLYDGGQNKLRVFTDGSLVTPDYNHMIIQRDGGEIAINTETFATGYQVSVNGKIACTEILVQDPGAWPDYVFTDDYKLLTIEEVEQHIAEKGYLPNIPSAKEIEENGVELGDMNKRLMEKVEELTLYIIQQNNRMKEQDARIRQLEEKQK